MGKRVWEMSFFIFFQCKGRKGRALGEKWSLQVPWLYGKIKRQRERGRVAHISTPPPSKWESKSKSCCLSVLLCCDVAQAQPSTQQTAFWTSTHNQHQCSLLRAGGSHPATSLSSTACLLYCHVPWGEPGVWRGRHCGLFGRDIRLRCPHPCSDSSLQPLQPWLLLCSSGRWHSSVPGQWVHQSSCVRAFQPTCQPLHAPAEPPLSGSHFNSDVQVRQHSFYWSQHATWLLCIKVPINLINILINIIK